VTSLGASAAVDYHDRDAVEQIIVAIGDSPLAGVLAIGTGALKPALEIAQRLPGAKRVAAAQPGLIVGLQQRNARRKGLQLSAIWAGSLKNNAVGPGVYVDFLPAALAARTYVVAPEPIIAGTGLEQIPAGMKRLKEGVSAKKVVVAI